MLRADCDKLLQQSVRGEKVQVERDSFHEARVVEAEARIGVRFEELAKALSDLAGKCDELNLETRSEAQKQINSMESIYDQRVGAVEFKMSTFDTAVSEAAGVPTRRVEWLIQ